MAHIYLPLVPAGWYLEGDQHGCVK